MDAPQPKRNSCEITQANTGAHDTTQPNRPDGSRPVKFYHSTYCKICTKGDIRTNTHRTDFVGYEHANRAFDITKYSKIHNPLYDLRDLVENLMKRQGAFFFLNEYPEECSHLQFIDLDAPIPNELLDLLIVSLEDLTIGGEVLVLRNTVSRKVHLIMNVLAGTRRHSHRKMAINKWLCSYLFHSAGVREWYTEKQWQEEIFDLRAAGIRSALSVKMKNGKLEPNKGVYAPPDGTIDGISCKERVDVVIKYSIYNEPTAQWSQETLRQFDQAEREFEMQRAEMKSRMSDNYDNEKRTIPFLGGTPIVCGDLINTFIKFLPLTWGNRSRWFFTLTQVKTAALLVDGFDPTFFLHVWSAQNEDLYNKAGNDDRYARCIVSRHDAGVAITWLRNKAASSLALDVRLAKGTDRSLAKAFASLASDRIKVLSENGTCFMWNEKLRLWKLKSGKWIEDKISSWLSKAYLDHAKELGQVTVDDEVVTEHLTKKIKFCKKQEANIEKPSLGCARAYQKHSFLGR